MLGNFVTGTSVLAPAGMLSELASGLDVGIREAGLLITFGAVMLCIGSPLTAWLTSRIERRTLLGGTLAVLGAANFSSAFAPDYAILPVIRLVMLPIGSLYTPPEGRKCADRQIDQFYFCRVAMPTGTVL
jgi:DHA1 family inner membrane transport protein